MKRLCNDQEKQQLYNNKSNICVGTFYRSAGIGIYTVFLSLLVWMVLLFGTLPFVADIFNKIVFYLWMMFLLFIARIIVGVISIKLRVVKDKKNFLKASDIYVNGATVVRIDDNYIYYIEDDEKSDDGYPYIIRYNSIAEDRAGLAPWDRIIVLYGSYGKNDSVQLMKLTPEIRYIIPEYSGTDLTRLDINTLEMYPHPACRYISKYPRKLDQDEKNRLLNSSTYSNEHRNAIRILIVCSIIIFLCLNIFITGICYEGSYELTTIIGIYCVGNALIALFIMFLFRLRMRNEKRMFDLDVVTEAVYISSTMGTNNTQVATVYEWKDGSIQEVDYTNCLMGKLRPGDILYKYNIGKRTVFCKKI